MCLTYFKVLNCQFQLKILFCRRFLRNRNKSKREKIKAEMLNISWCIYCDAFIMKAFEIGKFSRIVFILELGQDLSQGAKEWKRNSEEWVFSWESFEMNVGKGLASSNVWCQVFLDFINETHVKLFSSSFAMNWVRVSHTRKGVCSCIADLPQS